VCVCVGVPAVCVSWIIPHAGISSGFVWRVFEMKTQTSPRHNSKLELEFQFLNSRNCACIIDIAIGGGG
jgi:hypothetical protein